MIGGYFWIQKTLAETSKLKAEVLAEVLAIQESLRKAKSEPTSKDEFPVGFPKLLKAHWLSFVGFSGGIICFILFFITLALPPTPHVSTLMISLASISLFTLLNVGFYEIRRQAENNRRIQEWLIMETILFLAKNDIEITYETAEGLAHNDEAIIKCIGALSDAQRAVMEGVRILLKESIDKLDKSPGNHSDQ
jgi:hypothetical protein